VLLAGLAALGAAVAPGSWFVDGGVAPSVGALASRPRRPTSGAAVYTTDSSTTGARAASVGARLACAGAMAGTETPVPKPMLALGSAFGG
jgi:hypothetical protein